MSQWRAIQTHTLREPFARDYLERKEVKVYLPMIVRRVRHKRPISRALFPGYLFADCEGQSIAVISYLPGVVRVLGTRALPDAFMTALRNKMDEPPEQRWTPGQLYQLRRPGALGELIVKLERLDKRGQGIIALDFFGVRREATVKLADLEAL